MARDQVRNLQDDATALAGAATAGLDELNDAMLGTLTADGRTLRRALHDLTDLYDERLEQLLWTKWGQRIPRSEAKRVVAELQAARARFAAYLAALDDDQVHVKSAQAGNASAWDVASEVFEEERRTMDLVTRALRESERR
jgi:hypothetical protein